jgi:hypothetical protein
VKVEGGSGFPFVISQPGSYRLTGNLTVDQNTTAIQIGADNVTLDLNGFAIIGPTVCSGAPLICTPSGSGSGVVADQANNINDTFTVAFDGSAAGIAPELDVDGAYYVHDNGHLLLSLDGSGTLGSPPVACDDEDVLEYDPSTDIWELVYDGSVRAAGWPPADLTALFAFPIPATASPTRTSLPTPPPGTPTGTATTVPSTMPTGTASLTATAPSGTVTSTSGQSPAATHTQTPTPIATSTATAPSTTTPSAGMSPTAGPICAGDCNGNGEVAINELVLMVNIALGSKPVTDCLAGDIDHNGAIRVNEIITAVNNALGSCG